MEVEYQLKPDSNNVLGTGFIIVNGFGHSTLRERTGMKAEIKLLTAIFISLGLKPEIYSNLTARKFRDLVEHYIKKDCVPIKDSMVAMAISSHGFNEHIEFMPENPQKAIEVEKKVPGGETPSDAAADRQKEINENNLNFIKMEEITEAFSAAQFIGIPKLFIINACRGNLTDSESAKNPKGDKFTILSTLSMDKSLKAEYLDHGDVPFFFRHLYKQLHRAFSYGKDSILIGDLYLKINDAMVKDKLLEKQSEIQMCELRTSGNLKKLRLWKINKLEEYDRVLSDSKKRRYSVEESDITYIISKKLLRTLPIKGLESISCIAINKEDDCFYFADPIAGKVFVLFKETTKLFDIDFGKLLITPRFVEYFPEKRLLFISHDSGIEQVVMDKNNPGNPRSLKTLIQQKFISPCLAGDKKHGLLYILNRIGEDSNKVMKIIEYRLDYEEMDKYSLNINEIPDFYAPIILDMKFSNSEKPTIIILVYHPLPHLLLYNLENRGLTSKKLNFEDPAFLAIYDNSVFISCPDSKTIGIWGGYGGHKKPISIPCPNALISDSNGEILITSFVEKNICKLLWYEISPDDALI